MPSISPRMVGLYLVIFWVQCVVGVGINVYNQVWQRADSSIADTILQVILVSGAVGIGAATNSLIVVITAEGIMVLAAWVKKRQFAEGVEVGKKQGISEERERANAKMRAWAKDAMEAQRQGKPIPFDELPIEDETKEESS